MKNYRLKITLIDVFESIGKMSKPYMSNFFFNLNLILLNNCLLLTNTLKPQLISA